MNHKCRAIFFLFAPLCGEPRRTDSGEEKSAVCAGDWPDMVCQCLTVIVVYCVITISIGTSCASVGMSSTSWNSYPMPIFVAHTLLSIRS